MQVINVIVAIGANLPDAWGGTPLQTCMRAAGAVSRLAGFDTAVCSRWFSSASFPDPAAPRYTNGVVRLTGVIAPDALLAYLQSIECSAGRTRSVPNAPRTLDLDIIDMGGLVRPAPDPILPHPRAHRRAFVLHPLRDVWPSWRHPVTGETIAALMAALPPQDIHPLTTDHDLSALHNSDTWPR